MATALVLVFIAGAGGGAYTFSWVVTVSVAGGAAACPFEFGLAGGCCTGGAPGLVGFGKDALTCWAMFALFCWLNVLAWFEKSCGDMTGLGGG